MLKKIFNPNWLILFFTSIISIVGVFYIFTNDAYFTIIAYLVYVTTLYSAVILFNYMIRYFIYLYKKLKVKISNHKYVIKYKNDFTFRTKILLYSALFINLIFVFSKMITGLMYNSIWFIILGLYYLLLVIIRIRLVIFTYVNRIKVNMIAEHKQAIKSSLTLLLINVVLILILIFIIIYGESFNFPGLFIYVMSLYTIYSVVTSIISMIKYKKYKSPIMSTSRIVSLASALIMLLALETAILARFNNGITNDNVNNVIIGVTGIVIALTILGLCLYKIIKSIRILKKLKKENLFKC